LNDAAAGMNAGWNLFMSFLQSKKLTAQKRQGRRFWAVNSVHERKGL
jgi:hypothetical protein